MDSSVPSRSSAVPTPDLFPDLGEWFKYVRSAGFNVPVQVPWAIERAQKAWDLEPTEAMVRLVRYGLIVIYSGGVTVDLRATIQDLDTLVTNLKAEKGDG